MELGSEEALRRLQERVVSCRRCARLTQYISDVARRKARRYRGEEYWGRPLPGFGDPEARLLIIGLAPAAHGGNRTGRMFTGDSSGDWLFKALHEVGFANQPSSISRDDGLRLISAYITATVRCAPPRNTPTREEIENCSQYLVEELRLLRRIQVVLTLGRVAFDNYLGILGRAGKGRPAFSHGAIFRLGDGLPILFASYHPSRQNTQTGRLSWGAWLQVFQRVQDTLRISIPSYNLT